MQRLLALQNSIAAKTDPELAPDLLERVSVVSVQGELHVEFYGNPFDEAYEELIDAIVEHEVADNLASLVLRGPDEGANGTRNWDLSGITTSNVVFPKLRKFSIQRKQPGDHNTPIVGTNYEENGMLSNLLAKTPRLQALEAPSAPSSKFFDFTELPLRNLLIDAGFDHQDFIANLARSSCFNELRVLEFGECDPSANKSIPCSEYRTLFSSHAFKSVRVFFWRNPKCTADEIAELKAIRRDCSIMVLRWSANWVR